MAQVQTTAVTAPQRLAESYLQLVSNMASAAVGGGAAILLGFSPIHSSFPVLGFVDGHPQLVLALGGALLVTLAIAITITQRGGLARWLGNGIQLRAVRFIFSAVLSAVGSAVIGIVLGFSALPSSIPLLGLLRVHPPVGIALLVISLGLLILAPLFGGDPHGASQFSAGPGPGPRQRLLLATAVSALSALLFISLLVTVVVRPSWCPSEICPAPVLVTNPLGVHDADLEVFPTAVQSTTFAIPSDPASYSLAQNNLPRNTGALRSDETYPPYRVVVGVHSLQRGANDSLTIEQIAAVIDAVSTPDVPLNVWNAGADVDYTSDPYQAMYRGEPAGASLIAFSTHTPPTHVLLREGESDEIDLQVTAKQPVVLQFHVELTYNLNGGDFAQHTLSLPQQYKVVFSDSSNWHVYQLQNGQFVPTDS
ncbi:MAG TPA: hypothetical protein VF120_16555 [Ktedonobacterales bacterium]